MRLQDQDKEQLRQRRDKLSFELAKAKADLKDAEERNDLRDYRLADYHVSYLESEIVSIDEKLHPFVAGVFGNKCHPSKHHWGKWEYYTNEGYRGRVCIECGEYDVDTLDNE